MSYFPCQWVHRKLHVSEIESLNNTCIKNPERCNAGIASKLLQVKSSRAGAVLKRFDVSLEQNIDEVDEFQLLGTSEWTNDRESLFVKKCSDISNRLWFTRTYVGILNYLRVTKFFKNSFISNTWQGWSKFFLKWFHSFQAPNLLFRFIHFSTRHWLTDCGFTLQVDRNGVRPDWYDPGICWILHVLCHHGRKWILAVAFVWNS